MVFFSGGFRGVGYLKAEGEGGLWAGVPHFFGGLGLLNDSACANKLPLVGAARLRLATPRQEPAARCDASRRAARLVLLYLSAGACA